MKVPRLQRVLRLVTLLQSGSHFSPADLARELGVTRRTIFRDLNMLQKAGVPYRYDETQGGYRLADTFYLPPLNLTLAEALALLLLAQHAAGDRGLPLQQKARHAALKIQAALPRHIRRQCGSALQATSVHLAPHARHDRLEQTFSLLQQAIRRRRQVRLLYDSLHEKKLITTTLDPYHLHFSRRAWYVIGRSSLHRQTRIFKLSRINHLEPLASCFLLERPFRIEDFLGHAWSLIPEGRLYHVKLLFSPLVARNVAEVLWHPTQTLTFRDDGRLVYRARVDGLTEITWWIMGYADQVEVLAPVQLRRRVADMARRTADIYRTDEPALSGYPPAHRKTVLT